jgi:hypothetical protein
MEQSLVHQYKKTRVVVKKLAQGKNFKEYVLPTLIFEPILKLRKTKQDEESTKHNN